MVNGFIAGGVVGSTPARGQIRQVTIGGQTFSPGEFQRRLRGGEFGGQIFGRGRTFRQAVPLTLGETARARASREFRSFKIQTVRVETPDVTKVKTLFSASLSPKVRSILAFEAAGGGLEGARLQRFENLKAGLADEKAILDRQNKLLETQQNSLSKEVSAFNQDQQRLQRLANAGLLLPGVAKQNELKGKRLNESVAIVNKKVDKANASADTFNKGVQAINRTEQIAKVKVGEKIKEVKSQPIARFEAAPTKKEVREKLAFPLEKVVSTKKEFKERVTKTGEEFAKAVGVTSALGLAPASLIFAKQLGLVAPIGRSVGGVGEVFETGLRGVGATVETGIGISEQITGEPFGFGITLPKEVAGLVIGLKTLPIIGEPFKGIGIKQVTPTATELLFGKQQIARGAVAATELELLLGFPVTGAALRGIGAISGVVKVPKVTKVKAPKTPSALKKAIATERKRLIVETNIFGLPQRRGVVPGITKKISVAEKRFIDTISLVSERALTKVRPARLRLEQLALEKLIIPTEIAKVGAARSFERAFLSATGAGEKAEFGLGRAVEGLASRAASAEFQARLLGLRGQAGLIRTGRRLRQEAQLARVFGKAAKIKGVARSDILFGRLAKPVARAQFEASLLGLGVESKAVRLARIARQRAQLADIIGTTGLERALEVVTPVARVAARTQFEAQLIRLRVAARSAKGKARVRLLKQVAKIEVKEAARRTKLAARRAELGFERFVDPFTRPLARAAIEPTLIGLRARAPIARLSARAQQETQLVGIVGKTAAKRIAEKGIGAIAPSIAKAQLIARAPVRRLQFELGGFKPFQEIRIPVLEGIKPKRPRVPRKAAPTRRTAQEDIDEFIGVSDLATTTSFAPTTTGVSQFAPAQTFEQLQLQLGQIARGRKRTRQVLLLEEQAVPRFVPVAARVPKEAVSPFDVTSIISKSLLGLRVATGIGTKNITGITSINATALKDFERLTAKQFQEIGSGIRSGLRSQARTAEQTFTELAGLEAMQPISAIRTKARTRLRRATLLRLGLKTKITTVPKPPPPPPPLIPLLLELPTFETLLGRRRRRRQGFSVSVKSKGKFRKINRKPLTRSTALGLGGSIVDRSTARSFFISKSRRKGKPKRVFGLEGTFNPFKFRQPKGKTKLPKQAFVERSAFAIDTPEELAGITLKGLLALERRRRVRSILRVPKRRIKRRRK